MVTFRITLQAWEDDREVFKAEGQGDPDFIQEWLNGMASLAALLRKKVGEQ